jgi:hypothetical protein
VAVHTIRVLPTRGTSRAALAALAPQHPELPLAQPLVEQQHGGGQQGQLQAEQGGQQHVGIARQRRAGGQQQLVAQAAQHRHQSGGGAHQAQQGGEDLGGLQQRLTPGHQPLLAAE